MLSITFSPNLTQLCLFQGGKKQTVPSLPIKDLIINSVTGWKPATLDKFNVASVICEILSLFGEITSLKRGTCVYFKL